MLTRWERAYRIGVYVALWLVFFVPATIRQRRGERVPRGLHIAIFVAGMWVTVTIAQTCY